MAQGLRENRGWNGRRSSRKRQRQATKATRAATRVMVLSAIHAKLASLDARRSPDDADSEIQEIMTPERLARIKVATEKLLAAEQKRAASLPAVLAALAKEAPSWPCAELMAEYERARSK